MTAQPEPHGGGLGMPASRPQVPARVLVKGASTVNWTSWMGGPRGDFAYPRVIEEAMIARGRPTQVQDTSVAAQLTHEGLHNWQREVIGWSPDVVVLHYGHMECIHLMLPVWLQRHAQSLGTRPGPIRSRYRQVARPTWQALAKVQQRVDQRVDSTRWRVKPERVSRELELLISRIRAVGSPLVIVMELLPPAATYASWFPGMPERVRIMNASMRNALARLDQPDVRWFATSQCLRVLSDPLDLGVITPDGAHFSPAAHRTIGHALAAVIDGWAEEQPHLNPGQDTNLHSADEGRAL